MKNEFKQKEEYKFESVLFCQRAGRVTQLVRNFRGITEYFRFKIMSIYILFYTVCFCGNRCTNIDIHAYFDFCLVTKFVAAFNLDYNQEIILHFSENVKNHFQILRIFLFHYVSIAY